MLPDFKFWSKEKRMLWEVMAPFFIALIHSGGEAGAGLLPESLKVLINWDVFNQEAINYLRNYRLSWVNGISETTRTQSVNAIAGWIESGEAKPVLDARLAQILGPARAKRIATTEVTRIYARGNQLAWKATGFVTEQKWQNSQDSKVCPLCESMHNKTVSIDESFAYSPADIANTQAMKDLEPDTDTRAGKASNLLRYSGSSTLGPPAHPNCRCWLLPVVTEAGLERELEKMLHKSEIEQLVAGVRDDPRIVFVAKPVKKKIFRVAKPKEDIKKLIVPISERLESIEEKVLDNTEVEEMREDMAEVLGTLTDAIKEQKEGDINISVEPTPVTIKNIIEVPSVTIEPLAVSVEAPVVNVDLPDVNVEAPVVNVEAPEIKVENIIPEQEPRKTTVKRDKNGNIVEMVTK